MKYGLAIVASDEGPHPAELGRLAEAHGFESLFLPEHTHMPAAGRSPTPRGRGKLKREDLRSHDPFVALAAAAVATERLRLGTGICLLAQRDPIVTAKAAASLDQISAGRLLFGVGAGWNRGEIENHGTDPSHRFAVLAERVAAVRAIWTEEEASFHGDHVDFGPILCWPKPLSRPHPPILLGGNGARALGRVLDFADEWMPTPEADLPARIAELRGRAAAAGREVGVTVFGAEPERRRAYARAGVDRCVFWLPPRGEREIEARMTELAAMVRAG